jgi:huckebein
MTLIPSCVSEKIFRPWDESKPAPAVPSPVKEEPASPSIKDRSGKRSPICCSPVDHHHISGSYLPHPLAMSAAYSPLFANTFSPPPMMMPSVPAHWMHHPAQRSPQPVPSMEQFLASLEVASPEALHPSQLAALGMGPNEIGQLYQLAGYKPVHNFHPSATNSATATAKKQRPKRFRCPHCQVAFSNNGQLKGHVRSHTGNYRNILIRRSDIHSPMNETQILIEQIIKSFFLFK